MQQLAVGDSIYKSRKMKSQQATGHFWLLCRTVTCIVLRYRCSLSYFVVSLRFIQFINQGPLLSTLFASSLLLTKLSVMVPYTFQKARDTHTREEPG
jgi:hypothetical protein